MQPLYQLSHNHCPIIYLFRKLLDYFFYYPPCYSVRPDVRIKSCRIWSKVVQNVATINFIHVISNIFLNNPKRLAKICFLSRFQVAKSGHTDATLDWTECRVTHSNKIL